MTIVRFKSKTDEKVIDGEVVPAIVGKDGKTYVVVKGNDGFFHRIEIEEHEPQ